MHTATTISDIAASEEQFQLATYKKMKIAAERGEGVWIYTSDGDRYLDLYGGHAVAGTGHSHWHVVTAIREQTHKLMFYSNLVYSETRARAAEKLVSIATEGNKKGDDAIDQLRKSVKHDYRRVAEDNRFFAEGVLREKFRLSGDSIYVNKMPR